MIKLGHLSPTLRSLADYLSDLMLMFMFMFIYPKSSKTIHAMLGRIDVKMMHNCNQLYVDALFELNYEVVSVVSSFFNVTRFLTHQQIPFEDRFEGGMGKDCLMSVDGIEFRIIAFYNKSLYTYKLKRSVLWYKVGVCIKTGNICWWNDPFLPGDENANKIFQ